MGKKISISKFLLVFSLITVWVFSGWPQIQFRSKYVSFDFPPRVQQAYAATTTIFLTGTASTTWVVPSDWSNFNTIEVIGGGGGGRNSANGAGGGGGGAYAKISNLNLGTATSVLIQVGGGGAKATTGGDTWFNDATATSTTCGDQSVCAKGGAGTNAAAGGAGGSSTLSIGTVKNGGGDGGASGGTTGDSGGGGGGAAGPFGIGGIGGNSSNTASRGGGGGGGNGSGTIASSTTSSSGANGGNSCGTTCGGTAGDGGDGGAGAGGAGATGGGGAGGANAFAGGVGGTGAEWDSTHGSGGGGGGAGDANPTAVDGASGGLYGGGGGGGSGTGAVGRQGIIVIQYAPKATYEQSAYKWYANNNSSTVGVELTTGIQDASTTLAATGAAFRLRMLLHVTNNTSTPGVDTLKLQYASTTPGNCLPAFYGNSAFTDVETASGEIRYNNNALPADGDIVVTTSTDPTHGGDSRVNQTYEEQNNFTATTTIGVGADGKWDFSLIDFSAPANTTYCFQVIRSDGTFIATSTASKIPEIRTTASANSAPTVTSVVLNGSSAITLTPNATTSFNISYTITDTNGCADINTNKATSTAFRSGVSSICAVPGPTTNNLNCYLYVTRATSTCVSSNQINVTDTVQIYYFAQATDASSSFASDDWTAYALAVDLANATGSATSSAVELNTLLAINVTTSSINYGTLDASSTTGSINQNATTTNAGNSSTTLQVRSSATLTKGADSIATTSQRFATSSFTFPGGATQITDILQTVSGFFLTAPTSTVNVAQTTFWGLEIPAGNPTGTYSGTTVFVALFQP